MKYIMLFESILPKGKSLLGVCLSMSGRAFHSIAIRQLFRIEKQSYLIDLVVTKRGRFNEKEKEEEIYYQEDKKRSKGSRWACSWN